MGIAAMLAACAGTTDFDQLAGAVPQGTPFQQALFKNYVYLARSFAGGSTAARHSDLDDAIAPLADAFASKAMIAAGGHDVVPEQGNTAEQQSARARLVSAVAAGRDGFPQDAARAQAVFDCWVLNGQYASQYAASARCRGSFNASLAQLERDLRPIAAAPAPSGYTAYFDFDSWTLTAEALRVLQQAINDARVGRQLHIAVVGHTDTVGSQRYNLRLSKKRANVVKEALVDMGARRQAVDATGVGKNDLAIPTADGVREPRNRRAVVTLSP